MNDFVRIGGLGLVSTTLRQLTDKSTYAHLFPRVDMQQQITRRNGRVADVVSKMAQVVYAFIDDTKQLAPLVQGATLFDTCRNVFNFWYHAAQYAEDQKGLEQLRRPARLAIEQRGDCDDYSMAVAQTLINARVPYQKIFFRIARYAGKTYYQHVYVVVKHNGQEIIIDCVLDHFNEEKEPAEIKDFNVMETSNLNGIDIAVLSGTGANLFTQIITGSDFQELANIGNANTEQELKAVYDHIVKTRALLTTNPEAIKEVEHPETFIKMLDYAIKYWNTDKRDEALSILEQNEQQMNALQGLSGIDDLDIELSGMPGELGSLGRIRAPKRFFGKVKEAVKKVGQGIKNVAKAVVKYNPISLAARGGLLLAMKTNFLNYADRLKWGYLSRNEAQARSFDMGEWDKLKEAHTETENLYTKILQGSKEELKKHILEGKAGGLAGFHFGSLGVEPVTAATTTAAASGFLAKIGSFLKKVNPKKLLEKVKLVRDKIKERRENKNADSAPTTTDYTDTSNQRSSAPTTQDENNDSGDKPEEENFFKKNAPLLIAAGAAALLLPSLLGGTDEATPTRRRSQPGLGKAPRKTAAKKAAPKKKTAKKTTQNKTKKKGAKQSKQTGLTVIKTM